MATLHTYDFTGTNGDSWDADWTTGTFGGAGVVDIQGNAGRMEAGNTAYSVARALLSAMSSTGDQGVLFKWTPTDDAEQYLHVHLRHSGTWDATNSERSEDGYWFSIYDNGSSEELRLYKNVSGSRSTLSSGTSNAYSAATAYWIRAEATGTTIRARVWADGDSEPGTWDVSVTDASHASGVVALSVQNGNSTTPRTFTIDDYTVDDLVASGSALPLMMAYHGG